MPRWLLWLLAALLLLGLALNRAWALSPQQQLALASGDNEARLQALQQAVAAAQPGTAAFLQQLRDGGLRLHQGRVLPAVQAPPEAEEPLLNNRLRGALDAALAALQLGDADARVRGAALNTLRDAPDAVPLAVLEKARSAETDPAPPCA
jgi:urea transport system permease protein